MPGTSMFGGFATHPLQVFGHEGLVSLFWVVLRGLPRVGVGCVFRAREDRARPTPCSFANGPSLFDLESPESYIVILFRAPWRI